MFQQAITSKTSVGFEAAKGKDDPHPKRTQKMSYQKQVNSELAAIQSELQTLENEAKKCRFLPIFGRFSKNIIKTTHFP